MMVFFMLLSVDFEIVQFFTLGNNAAANVFVCDFEREVFSVRNRCVP